MARGTIAGMLLSFAVIAAAAPAAAQMEEVVVTAERRDDIAPSVVLVKRADHLITRIRAVCDTRDADQRRNELKATLRNMIAEAHRSQTLSLSVGDTVLSELKESSFDDIIEPDARPDTSRAYVVVKTSILPDDTLESATARVKDFIARTTKVGRTELLADNRWNLTLIGPEQYHDQIVALIAAQSKKTADLFGPGYGVSIDGLEHTVDWYQKGSLDLALYIPYTLHVAPLAAH